MACFDEMGRTNNDYYCFLEYIGVSLSSLPNEVKSCGGAKNMLYFKNAKNTVSDNYESIYRRDKKYMCKPKTLDWHQSRVFVAYGKEFY